MEIQTLNVVVPPCGNNGKCINNCPFCVSRMRDVSYTWRDGGLGTYVEDFRDRLAFARDNGCNTVILTSSNGEPLQNMALISTFGQCNDSLGDKRFRWIELQTTGVMLANDKLDYLRANIRVSTISLSICDLFVSKHNAEVIGMPLNLRVEIAELCKEIKHRGFTLRVSLNLIDMYDHIDLGILFQRLNDLGVDQVTFKVLYNSDTDCPQNHWIDEHRASKDTVQAIRNYIEEHGTVLETIPLRGTRYSVHGLSTIVDNNCMLQEAANTGVSFRYLVLREDCKLYSRWDDPASLVF